MRFFKPDLLKKSIALGVFLIVVLILTIPLITLVNQRFQELRQHAARSTRLYIFILLEMIYILIS